MMKISKKGIPVTETLQLIQSALEKYAFHRRPMQFADTVLVAWYVYQDDVAAIADQLSKIGIYDIDLVNAGQETSAEWQAGVLLYTERTAENLYNLVMTRRANDLGDCQPRR